MTQYCLRKPTFDRSVGAIIWVLIAKYLTYYNEIGLLERDTMINHSCSCEQDPKNTAECWLYNLFVRFSGQMFIYF